MKLLIVLFLVLLGSCQLRPGQASLAKVNGHTITVNDFKSKLKEYGDAIEKQTGESKKKMFNEVLNELLEQESFLIAAKEKNVSISKSELDQHIQAITQDYEQQDFKALLKSKGIDEDVFHQNIEKSMIVSKLIETITKDVAKPNPTDVLQFYNKHQNQFVVEKSYELEQIVLANEEAAKIVLQELNEGKDFNVMAKIHSLSEDGKNGGKLKPIPSSNLPDYFSKVVPHLKHKRHSSIIPTDYGFYIVRVTNVIEPRTKSFDETKAFIESNMLLEAKEKAVNDFKRDLFSKLKIERNYALFDQLL